MLSGKFELPNATDTIQAFWLQIPNKPMAIRRLLYKRASLQRDSDYKDNGVVQAIWLLLSSQLAGSRHEIRLHTLENGKTRCVRLTGVFGNAAQLLLWE